MAQNVQDSIALAKVIQSNGLQDVTSEVLSAFLKEVPPVAEKLADLKENHSEVFELVCSLSGNALVEISEAVQGPPKPPQERITRDEGKALVKAVEAELSTGWQLKKDLVAKLAAVNPKYTETRVSQAMVKLGDKVERRQQSTGGVAKEYRVA